MELLSEGWELRAEPGTIQLSLSLVWDIGLNPYMGGCQNDGRLLGPPNTRCIIILRTQKGTIILAQMVIGRNRPLSQTS